MASESKIQALLTVNSAQLQAQSAQINAQKITNNLLSDVLNAQIKTNGLLGAQNAISRKRVSADKFSAQENAIEKFRKKNVGKKSDIKLPGKINWKNVLGLGALTLGVAALVSAIDGISRGLAGFADRLDGIAQGLEDFEVKVRETAGKVRDFLTPIPGFSMFGLRQASMGVDAAKSGRYATTGRQVRGAVGKGIANAARGTANLTGKAIKGTGNLALDGVEAGLNRIAATNTATIADKLDDIAIRQGARARSTTLATGLTPKTLKDSLVSALKTTREKAAGFVSSTRQGAGRGLDAIKAAPGNLNTQRKLFMQGITGADDVSVLRTAGRPFPNVARGAGSLADEVGGFFRAGRGLRTGAQNAVSATRQAVSAATPQGVKQFIAVSKAAGPQAAILGVFDDIVKNLKNLKVKTITSLGSALKALPGQFATLGKSLKGFAGGIKTAVANFDLGKAAIQVSKVGSRGAQGLAKGAAGIVRGVPGAAGKLAETISRARAPMIGPKPPPGLLSRTGTMLKDGAGAAVKGTGSVLKRFPVLGSLISAGFGALEANTEEMERLRAENPEMTDEQIKAGLADGTLKKDKAKIIGRSAGAGAGAGVGTVVGGILGSALGPIGTAVGAAAGAWLGENVGKFLGEGFANTFKTFDWGKTFGPVIDTFKSLAGSITGALDAVAGAFGIKGDGEGGSGGFIVALKNIGRIIGIIAKLLLKTLAPALNLVMNTIKAVVDGITMLIKGISAVIGGVFNLVKGITSNPLMQVLPGVKELNALLSGGNGDIIGSISNFIDGNPQPAVDPAAGQNDPDLPQGGREPRKRKRGYGIGGGFNLFNPFSWGKSVNESIDNARDNANLGGNAFGYNNRYKNVTDPNMRRMLGLPEGGRTPKQKGRGGKGGRGHGIMSLGGRGRGIGGPAVRVSSHRGMRWGRMHQGVDIAPTGSKLHMPMYLPKPAKIVDKRREGGGDAGYGNSIYFTTSDGITHLYAHMKNPSKLKVGSHYPAGTQVGLMGYSGNTDPKGPDGTHLHWETGTNEADVGRSGSSLFDPLSKYSKFAPFKGTPGSDGPDSDYDPASVQNPSEYSDRSSGLLVSPATNMVRDFATNVRNTGERLQKSMESQGMESGLAASLGAALAPLGNLKQSLMEAVSAGRPAPAVGSADGGGVSSDGDVSMFPTSSPVRDGGHVFQGDV